MKTTKIKIYQAMVRWRRSECGSNVFQAPGFFYFLPGASDPTGPFMSERNALNHYNRNKPKKKIEDEDDE